MLKRKYAEESLKAIREMTTVTIPSMIDTVTDVSEYLMNQRAALNNLLIEFCLGCEITVGASEKGNKVKFNHHLPSMGQVKECYELISTFIQNVENQMFARLTPLPEDGSDMSIPVEFNVKVGGVVQRVQMLDKPTEKKMKSEIFDRNIIQTVKMDGNDILTLAALGSEVRKRRCRNQRLIIGGVSILLMGGVVTWAIMSNRKHDNDEEVEDIDASDAPDVDMSDIDTSGTEDVPQVEMETA